MYTILLFLSKKTNLGERGQKDQFIFRKMVDIVVDPYFKVG